MDLYKRLTDDDTWLATVCGSMEEAQGILCARPDVIQLNSAGRNEHTEKMWAQPGELFIKDVSTYPDVWHLVPFTGAVAGVHQTL